VIVGHGVLLSDACQWRPSDWTLIQFDEVDGQGHPIGRSPWLIIQLDRQTNQTTSLDTYGGWLGRPLPSFFPLENTKWLEMAFGWYLSHILAPHPRKEKMSFGGGGRFFAGFLSNTS
jgi:hypothetical protein